MRRWHIADAPTQLQLNEIAQSLRDGGVVLMPTDTIYGLHALASDAGAVALIAELKGRDDTKPFIVLAGAMAQLPELGIEAEPEVLQSLAAIWPAPLTAILPRKLSGAPSPPAAPAPPRAAVPHRDTIAVRIPALDWLRQLAERTGPLVSTSANRSGEPPVTTPDALARELQSRIDGIVDGGLRDGEPSAIVDLTGSEPRFIREGEGSFTQFLRKTLWKSL